MAVTPARAASPAGRSMADDVRARSDEQLAELLRLRQDLARPTPSDLSALAARASTRASVQRVIDSLDVAHLRVLEAALAVEAPVQVSDVAALLGVQSGVVEPVLDDLWALALLWRSPEGTKVVRTAQEVLPHPAGLGPPAIDAGVTLPDASALSEVIAAAPTAARAILDRLTWGPPAATLPPGTPDRVAEAARWLLERHLVATSGSEQIVLPREVALSLRGGRLYPESSLEPPHSDGDPRDPAAVDAVAGQEVTDLLSLVDELAAEWGLRPPRVLRSGGLAVRDLRRLATVLDVDEPRAAFVAEAAYAAGLVADDGSLDPSWAPTPAYDDWQQQPGAERWSTLASSWLTTTRAPHLVGSRHRAGRGP